jgi:hypothetical protein
MFRKSIVLTLALCTAAAFAAPKPSEVKAAFAAHDYLKAESLLGQVLAEKPGSAPAHWQLGQVYSAEGKHKQALNEMRQAQQLDPSFKFASNAANAVKIIGDEQALVAPPVAVVASPITIPQGYAVVAQTAPAPAQADSGGHGGLIVFLVLLLIVAGAGAYFFLGKKKESADASKELTDKKTQLLDLSKRLEDSVLIAKTSGLSEADTTTILGRITGLQQSVRMSLADIKDGKAPTNNYLANLGSMVDKACEIAQYGIPTEKPTPMPPYQPTPTPQPSTDHPVYGQVDAIRPIPAAPTPSYVAPTPTQTVFHHHYPVPAPAPVVVNNGGNDLLTGVLLGEALSRPERVVERTVYVEERAPAPAPRYERQLDTSRDDSYDAPGPAPAPYYAPEPEPERYSAPDLDTSSNDSWDSGSSSMDTGSSSDSGSSDSY